MWDIHVRGCQFRGITGRECPPDCLYCYAVANMDVLGYVFRIVTIDEIALNYLPKRHEGDSRQKEVD